MESCDLPDLENTEITEIFISANSPPFNNIETITITRTLPDKNANMKHSGLSVQGQDSSWEISKPSEKELPPEDPLSGNVKVE